VNGTIDSVQKTFIQMIDQAIGASASS